MTYVFKVMHNERGLAHEIPFCENADYYLAISPALDVLQGEVEVISMAHDELVLCDYHGHAFRVRIE